jgi:hypothetical protein
MISLWERREVIKVGLIGKHCVINLGWAKCHQ